MTTTAQDQQARLVVRVHLQIGETTYQLGDAELAYEIPVIRTLLAPMISREAGTTVPSDPLSPSLREQIATLCARLGAAEPRYDQLGQAEAETVLARLQAEEEDLLQTAAQAQTLPSPTPEMPPVEPALIRQLKQRWRAQSQRQESVEDLQRAWGHFKQQICGEAISDRAIDASQYEHLLAALTSPATERTPRR